MGPHTVPGSDLEWRFTTSGGPGGQHANRSNTRAELTLDLTATEAFPDGVRDRIIDRLGADALSVSVAESRSQFRNRMLARAQLRERLEEAMRVERKRRATRPTRSSKRRRLADKRARGEKKRLRRPPEPE